MNNDASQYAARAGLALTEWELANFHLPSVTTVTLYSGRAPVRFLRHRIALMRENNRDPLNRVFRPSRDS
jgi:hypothetical protein